jgi:hypothetical protein
VRSCGRGRGGSPCGGCGTWLVIAEMLLASRNGRAASWRMLRPAGRVRVLQQHPGRVATASRECDGCPSAVSVGHRGGLRRCDCQSCDLVAALLSPASGLSGESEARSQSARCGRPAACLLPLASGRDVAQMPRSYHVVVPCSRVMRVLRPASGWWESCDQAGGLPCLSRHPGRVVAVLRQCCRGIPAMSPPGRGNVRLRRRGGARRG